MAMLRSLGCTLLTLRSPMKTSPPELGSSPAMIDSSVDLPQPDGPSSTRKPPSSSSMSILFKHLDGAEALANALDRKCGHRPNP